MQFEERPSHSETACEQLLGRFLLEPVDQFAYLFDGTTDVQSILQTIGCALWDVFSDNHTVIDADGTAYDLGSFRASGDVIADTMNRRYSGAKPGFGYLDFYMGSLGGNRPCLPAVYRWIFATLMHAGCDWVYSFPRLYAIDLGTLDRADDMLAYDPGAAVQAELERQARAERHDALVEDLDRAYQEDVRRARDLPLPITVAAYRAVFGQLPVGWPHQDQK